MSGFPARLKRIGCLQFEIQLRSVRPAGVGGALALGGDGRSGG
jgi:hypothetical protein